MSISNKSTVNSKQEENYEPKITVEKILQIFEYGSLKKLVGAGYPILEHKYKVGNNMEWESEEQFITGYNDVPSHTVPPHIKWATNPFFLYVTIVDNKVNYHYGEGNHVFNLCPITTDINHIKLIDNIFEYYYNEFGLPEVLNKLKKTKNPKKSINDKMKFLEIYIKSTDPDFFNDNFYEGVEISDNVMWIDWREEDESIIKYCENILKTKQLSAKTLNAKNDLGFETTITYKNKVVSIPFKGKGSYRDITIKTLNEIIQPDFEIRFCKESLGSDTLCYIPLSNEQWNELDKKHPILVKRKFEKITPESELLG